MTRKPAIALIAIMGLGLAGCSSSNATPEEKQHEFGCAAGTVSGAVVGGVLGSFIGAGTGQLVATGAGAALGGYAGKRLACG